MENEEIMPGQDKESPDHAEPTVSAHTHMIEDKVRHLAQLRDDGMLTYEEFAAKKADLLAQL